MNKDAKNKEVEEKVTIACGFTPECCMIDFKCEATYHQMPNGNLVWKHCGC
ncbi:hypothetical protein ABES13_27750 [Bacillus pseudomycoides]|jgi:hypothetical protein|uniref:hypothetical protein n=1 Tax=Bacillus pseudomycoides TaxID=64104 RepID=UPI0015CEFCD7|nr:hypothetical protein [Bacillus pseudomycoides]